MEGARVRGRGVGIRADCVTEHQESDESEPRVLVCERVLLLEERG
jgi:hypothetical protein